MLMNNLPKNKKKITIEQFLDNVSYTSLNNPKLYVPSAFAYSFISFLQLMYKDIPDFTESPPFHYKIADSFISKSPFIINICFRGAAKTVIAVYGLIYYIAVFEKLPEIGEVPFLIYVGDTVENGVMQTRANLELLLRKSSFLRMNIDLEKTRFTNSKIVIVNNAGHELIIKLYGAQTGIRGANENNSRPKLAILDDLMSDKVSRSPTTLALIKDTIYKGVLGAMHPTKKIIFNGTPFHKEDPIIEATESGSWMANVYPIAERFPCSKETFSPAWPERWPYEKIKEQYDLNVGVNRPQSFYQEYMLQISNEEDKLVPTSDLRWYKIDEVLNNKSNYNFYITTDFAVSDKQTADYTVISIWAFDSNNNWYLVDGIIKKQTMDITIKDLFKFINKYNPHSIGIETTGQQAGILSWVKKEMNKRNQYIRLAKNTKQPGIKPQGDKFSRFNLIVPLFTEHKIFFPEELRDTDFLSLALSQISSATTDGFKGKDDFLDTVSMLQYMKPIKPSTKLITPEFKKTYNPYFDYKDLVNKKQDDENSYGINSYLV